MRSNPFDYHGSNLAFFGWVPSVTGYAAESRYPIFKKALRLAASCGLCDAQFTFIMEGLGKAVHFVGDIRGKLRNAISDCVAAMHEIAHCASKPKQRRLIALRASTRFRSVSLSSAPTPTPDATSAARDLSVFFLVTYLSYFSK